MSIKQKRTIKDFFALIAIALSVCMVVAIWIFVLNYQFGNIPLLPILSYAWFPDADITLLIVVAYAIIYCALQARIKLYPLLTTFLFVAVCLSLQLFWEYLKLYNQKDATSQVESEIGTVSRIHIKGDDFFESVISATRNHSHDISYAIIQFNDTKKFKVTNSKIISLLNKGDVVSVKLKKGNLYQYFVVEMEFTSQGKVYVYNFDRLYTRDYTYQQDTLHLDPRLNEKILKKPHAYRYNMHYPKADSPAISAKTAVYKLIKYENKLWHYSVMYPDNWTVKSADQYTVNFRGKSGTPAQYSTVSIEVTNIDNAMEDVISVKNTIKELKKLLNHGITDLKYLHTGKAALPSDPDRYKGEYFEVSYLFDKSPLRSMYYVLGSEDKTKTYTWFYLSDSEDYDQYLPAVQAMYASWKFD